MHRFYKVQCPLATAHYCRSVTIEQLTKENQELRDEVNRLKGEQGKPNIRHQSPKSGKISSEQERNRSGKENKKKEHSPKNLKLHVTRQTICKLDKSKLPEDTVFKGSEAVIVQDVKVLVEVIKFKKEVYYSASLNKSFMASLPMGYEGEFGLNLKSLILELKISV
ncbi:hypothetical protein WDW89_22060 [Deltaproteobacteria bacterium TL4]